MIRFLLRPLAGLLAFALIEATVPMEAVAHLRIAAVPKMGRAAVPVAVAGSFGIASAGGLVASLPMTFAAPLSAPEAFAAAVPVAALSETTSRADSSAAAFASASRSAAPDTQAPAALLAAASIDAETAAALVDGGRASGAALSPTLEPVIAGPSGGSRLRRLAKGAGTVARAAAGVAVIQKAADVMMSASLEGLHFAPHSITYWAFGGALMFVTVAISIAAHEWGHARVGDREGDLTPRMAGQITLNPLKFSNTITSGVMLFTSLLGMPAGLFYTFVQSPMLTDPANRGKMARVAIAGPLINLVIGGALLGLPMAIVAWLPAVAAMPFVTGFLIMISFAGAINILLGALNLVPLSILDGQRILRAGVPRVLLNIYDRLTVIGPTLLLLGWQVWLLLQRGQEAVESHGAGTVVDVHQNPTVLGLSLAAFVFFLMNVWQEVQNKRKRLNAIPAETIAAARNGAHRTIALQYPLVAGRSPVGATATDKDLPISWTGEGVPPEPSEWTLLPPHGHLTQLADLQKATRLDDGSQILITDGVRQSVLDGDLLMLGDGNGRVALLPASAVGGKESVRAMLDGAVVAQILGQDGSGRRVLTRPQMKAAIELSRRNGGERVYDLADGGPEPERESFRVKTPEGWATFVRVSALEKLAGGVR